MGRLIDADELIEFLDSERKSGLALHDFSQVGSYKNAIDFVENMATAYDVDKVVSELEQRSKEYNLGVRLHGKPEEMRTDEAIEIVKQGGDANDVCEWIKYDYRTICPKNHDTNNPYWRIPDNMDNLKYCPDCGKKIKIVGD